MPYIFPSEMAKEHRLTLAEGLEGLVADGMVPSAEAERLKRERRYYKGDAHPLSLVAEQKWK